MLTFFAIPKPFRNHIGVIQINAIRSWALLRPECEVILFGDEEGTAEIASELGIHHIPEVECNEYGTPLVNSVFTLAQNTAKHQLMCYINADIILMSDFLKAVSQVRVDRFLMIGQRWDLDITELLDFDNPDWESHLYSMISKYGCLHPPSGVDYYLFSRELFGEIPPFAVGRTTYDNWLIFKARSLGAPVIDATRVVTSIHQNHERTYTSVGLQGPEGETDLTKGVESARNFELAGGSSRTFTLQYANRILTPRGLGPALTPRHLYFRMRAIPMLYPYFHFLLTLFRAFEKSVRIIRSIRAQL